MLLLRDLLCWDFRDVTHLSLNSQLGGRRSNISERARGELRRWMAADQVNEKEKFANNYTKNGRFVCMARKPSQEEFCTIQSEMFKLLIVFEEACTLSHSETLPSIHALSYFPTNFNLFSRSSTTTSRPSSKQNWSATAPPRWIRTSGSCAPPRRTWREDAGSGPRTVRD